MAIDTLAKLKTQVESFLHRAAIKDTDGSDNVENLISIGETWIFRNARTSEMEATLSGTIGSDGTLAVPSDYAALKHARVTQTPSAYLKMRPSSWIYERYPLRSASGVPAFIGRDGASFVFGPYPSSTYTIAGFYYAKPTTVLSSANALFVAHPDLYLYAALAVTEAFVKNNQQVAFWVSMRDQIMRDANRETDEGQYGTGMAIMADMCPLPG